MLGTTIFAVQHNSFGQNFWGSTIFWEEYFSGQIFRGSTKMLDKNVGGQQFCWMTNFGGSKASGVKKCWGQKILGFRNGTEFVRNGRARTPFGIHDIQINIIQFAVRERSSITSSR